MSTIARPDWWLNAMRKPTKNWLRWDLCASRSDHHSPRGVDGINNRGWHLHQMDFKNVFLQGNLAEQVYMVQPSRFRSNLKKLAVCRLKKSFYGLKQTPHAWNSKINQLLRKVIFEVSKPDSLLFIRKGQKGTFYILLYVDDLVITGSDLAEISRVKSQLSMTFEMNITWGTFIISLDSKWSTTPTTYCSLNDIMSCICCASSAWGITDSSPLLSTKT